jgi:proton-coupled amino acid transporter
MNSCLARAGPYIVPKGFKIKGLPFFPLSLPHAPPHHINIVYRPFHRRQPTHSGSTTAFLQTSMQPNDEETAPTETTGLLNSHPTYRAGENPQRLADQALALGLDRARPSRQATAGSASILQELFHDHTFSAAMMHSVGSLAGDEYVDNRGSIHLVSMRRRRRPQTVGANAAVAAAAGGSGLVRENSIPSYGNLQDLFQKQQQGLPETLMETTDVEEEDFEVDDHVEGGSLTAAIFGIIKGTVGPAILYLPRGFKMAGWACAIPALCFATFSYIYSAHRLLECWKVEDARQRLLAQRMGELQSFLTGNPTVSPKSPKTAVAPSENSDMAAFSPKLLTYPELARRAFGNYAVMIEFGIAAMQFGVCLTYLIFVPANLYASCQQLFGLEIPRPIFLIGMLLVEIPCTWIRDIRKLTPLNVLATVLIAYGLGSCLIIACCYSYFEKVDETLWDSMKSLPTLQPTWFLFIGTAFFVFEGSITLVVPLQEAVYKQEDRDRFPQVNQQVTSYIVAFYIVFAMICWASFEDRMQTALTASLPEGIYSTTVQFAYSIAVIFTYPLQAFPAMEVTLKNLNSPTTKGHTTPNSSKRRISRSSSASRDDKTEREVWRRNFFATLLNVGLGIIAVIAIDYLGNVVSLLGSLVGMPIALVYPPIMHNVLVKDAPPTTRYMNYFVSGIGIFAAIAASYATLVNWNEGGE